MTYRRLWPLLLLAACTTPLSTVDGHVHAEGASLASWELEPAQCTADQSGAQTVDAPGGGAVPNVRLSVSGSGPRLEVTGLGRAEPVYYDRRDCATLDVVEQVDWTHVGGNREGHRAYFIDGYARIDCASADGRITGTLRFAGCQ